MNNRNRDKHGVSFVSLRNRGVVAIEEKNMQSCREGAFVVCGYP
jgi:hypothetical protein